MVAGGTFNTAYPEDVNAQRAGVAGRCGERVNSRPVAVVPDQPRNVRRTQESAVGSTEAVRPIAVIRGQNGDFRGIQPAVVVLPR